jgi:hypothetical protein
MLPRLHPSIFFPNPFKFIIHQSSYHPSYMVWMPEVPLSVSSFPLTPMKANSPNQLQFALSDFTSRHALLHRRTDICMYASGNTSLIVTNWFGSGTEIGEQWGFISQFIIDQTSSLFEARDST